MPPVAYVTVTVPEPVNAAIAAFSCSQLRVAVLGRLSEAGTQTIVELAAYLGTTSRQALYNNLSALEALGVVYGEPPPGQRHGRRDVIYQLDRDRLREVVAALTAYVEGAPVTDPADENSR